MIASISGANPESLTQQPEQRTRDPDVGEAVRLERGAKLGRYEITAAIGAGGMGEVYRARDSVLGREVAVKVLPARMAADPAVRARFVREAQAIARLSHPNILAIHDFDAEGEVAFAVTELLEGESLRALAARGPVAWRRAVDLAAATAEALAAAHAAGVVHRDLKPENLFLTADGQVKVLDFGLARLDQRSAEATDLDGAPTLTTPGVVMGTIGYMAPEQVRGEEADHRTDIFALGCVLYELLAGVRAFAARSSAEVLAALLGGRHQPLADAAPGTLPEGLIDIVERCLEASPAARFQSAADLAFALRRLATRAVPGVPVDAPAEGGEPSVAVLPFTNLSADPEQEFFCDGTAEEVINALAQIRGLQVVARTSSFAFKGRRADVREIGRQLGVRTVLEGSVRRSGDRIRITAQLVETATGYHLWSKRFDRQLEDVFAIQDEIALAVARNLEVRLLGGDASPRRGSPTPDLDAHTALLRARFEWNAMSAEGFLRSRELLEQALRIEPDFADAKVDLAVWFLSQTYWGHLEPTVALTAAAPLLEEAIALDPEAAAAYAARANVAAFLELRWEDGERDARRAIELAPSLSQAHMYLGGQLLLRGRCDEAAAETALALKLDPISPTWASWSACWLGHAGRREEAVAELEKLLEMYPEHWLVHWSLANVLAGEDPRAALHITDRAVALSGRGASSLGMAACLRHRLGERAEGDALGEELAGIAEMAYVPPSFLAWVQLARGDTEEGLAALSRARDACDAFLPFTEIGHGYLWPRDPDLEATTAALLGINPG